MRDLCKRKAGNYYDVFSRVVHAKLIVFQSKRLLYIPDIESITITYFYGVHTGILNYVF